MATAHFTDNDKFNLSLLSHLSKYSHEASLKLESFETQWEKSKTDGDPLPEPYEIYETNE